MSKLNNWWNREKLKAEALQSQIDQLTADKEAMSANLLVLSADLEQTQSKLFEFENIKKRRDESVVPYFVLTTERTDEVKGLEIEMDWNEAFVQHLRDAGHTGRTDEVLIQKWLAMLYEDVIDKLEDTIINSNTNASTSDFA